MQNISKVTKKTDFRETFWRGGRGPRNSLSDFGGDLRPLSIFIKIFHPVMLCEWDSSSSSLLLSLYYYITTLLYVVFFFVFN